MTTIDWTKLDGISLKTGSHNPPGGTGAPDACLLEAISWLAGERWSDSPDCVPIDIAAFGRAVNDWMREDERQALKALVVLMVGAPKMHEVGQRRSFRLADWAVREIAPLALDARGIKEQAALLRALVPVTNRETAIKARDAAAAARYAAAAADAADAYYAAADAAYYAAAYYAANAAANAAAYYAANADAAAAAANAADAARYAVNAANYAANYRQRVVESTVAVFREVCEIRDETGR